jgi:hypothetical protein
VYKISTGAVNKLVNNYSMLVHFHREVGYLLRLLLEKIKTKRPLLVESGELVHNYAQRQSESHLRSENLSRKKKSLSVGR